MNLVSHLIERRLQLPPPLTRDVVVHKDLRVPMSDGVELLANRWTPRTGGDGLPTALIRSPYGRSGPLASGIARPLAERGYQVVMQSTRGGFGSGGTFDPMRQERADGLATLDWLVAQPWSDTIVLFGLSYLGYVQWAIADQLPPQVKALIPIVTESALTLEFLRSDGMSLETPFGWGVMVSQQERPFAMVRQFRQERKTAQALRTLPLASADVAACGVQSAYVQDVLAHDADSERWAELDHTDRVAAVNAPVSSIAGWYDIFLPGQLRDFRILQEAGHPARLTVGPWTHVDFSNTPFTEAIEFGLAYARGEEPRARPPVRLYVSGQDMWRDFDSWPPPGYSPSRLYLAPDAFLTRAAPAAAASPGDAASAVGAVDRYRYDPADPTPAVGGVRLMRGGGAGRVDNSSLEARPDVLTYTTSVLEDDVEVIGEVSAEIWFSSSLRSADVFVRLCDVDPAGRSWNVCDGLVRLDSADDVSRADVRLWPTAYRFRRGHRIRVQVSSGAFPRYARNLGSGEPLATGTTLRAADQTVHHDAAHPSAIVLPIRHE
ncbi:CocE/NonD family hydrolase [Cryptosporangium sp. NPDC048952]|uniref:CocE/NonD family hydrolase n=1 Tax=Cryptosporangium sp. NPDC048952 TaxID=3363961 RepID=UPI0037213F6D